MANKPPVPFELEGIFREIEPTVRIERPRKTPIIKSTVTITIDDEQKAFFEVREDVIDQVEQLGLKNGDPVTFGFTMMGSEKNGKKYNNFIIVDITRNEQD